MPDTCLFSINGVKTRNISAIENINMKCWLHGQSLRLGRRGSRETNKSSIFSTTGSLPEAECSLSPNMLYLNPEGRVPFFGFK